MKLYLIIFSLFNVLVLSAQSKLNYVSMQRTACFGRCPEYTVELFKDGNMVYTGKKNVDKIGRFQSHISKNSMNKFLMEISRNKLSALTPFYKSKITDIARLNFIFELNGVPKSVKNAESGPPYLSMIGKSIDSLIENLEWEETHDTAKKEPEGPELNLNVKHDHQVSFQIRGLNFRVESKPCKNLLMIIFNTQLQRRPSIFREL